MLELTKQYFDKKLDRLATKDNIKKVMVVLETKIENEVSNLESQISKLDSKIEGEIISLAGMMSRRFDELENKLDVRTEVDQLKIKMNKVWSALNIKS